MPLHPADKKMFHTYLGNVLRTIRDLDSIAEGIKDREVSRQVTNCATDLELITTDMHDTLDRL